MWVLIFSLLMQTQVIFHLPFLKTFAKDPHQGSGPLAGERVVQGHSECAGSLGADQAGTCPGPTHGSGFSIQLHPELPTAVGEGGGGGEVCIAGCKCWVRAM